MKSGSTRNNSWGNLCFSLLQSKKKYLLNTVHPDVLFDLQGIGIVQSNTSFYCYNTLIYKALYISVF